MMLRWLPEDIMVHNEDLEGYHGLPLGVLHCLFFVCVLGGGGGGGYMFMCLHVTFSSGVVFLYSSLTLV